MAKMEIYQSKAQAKTQQVMNVGGTLSLPFEIICADPAVSALTCSFKLCDLINFEHCLFLKNQIVHYLQL